MSPTTRRLLLIEDLPVYVSLVKNLLRSSDITLDASPSLALGIQKSQEIDYDAVLLDLGLPDCQGLTTFLRFREACSTVPIIIFSSTDEEEIAVQALHNGAQDYLIKGPYLTNDNFGNIILMRSIKYAIERHRIQQEILRERWYLEQRVAERTREIREANLRLQKLASSLVTAQENERQRISLELHDEAGQFLTALKLSLKMIQSEIADQPQPLRDQFDEANLLAETIMNKLRTLAHNLRPPAIDAVGMSQTLQDYCQKIARQTGIKILYTAPNYVDLPSHIQLSLYRTVQEALTNVVKHANASLVEIFIESDAEQITMVVQDDGCGFSLSDLSEPSSLQGIGLLGMRDRIEAIGGVLTIRTEPGLGTRIHVSIPLQENL